MKKNMEELKKGLTIFLMIQNILVININGNLLERLAEWMYIEKKMVKFPSLKTIIFYPNNFLMKNLEILSENTGILNVLCTGDSMLF